jgi:predicted ATP-grasp superfamily ATP-dependent carboligase
VAKILVTDGEQRSALAVVRSLGRAGHEVSVCSPAQRPLAGASRYCQAAHRVTDPLTDVARFREDIRRIDQEQLDLILPTTDVSTVALLSAAYGGSARVVAPDPAAYFAVSDKAGLLNATAALGVHVPAHVTISRREGAVEEAYAWARERGFDVVLKPSRSVVLAERGLRKTAVRIVRGEDGFREALAAYTPEAYPLLVQERISGSGLGIFMLTHEGRPIASFAHRRIREKPPTGGVSVYSESVAARDDLSRAAQAILAHYRWSGVAMVEFKEDAATGTPYLMEVNGRFWGSLQLAIDAGIDFPALLVRAILGEQLAPLTSYKTGIRSRWFWGDVDHLIATLRAPASVVAAHPELRSRAGALWRFLVPWRPGDRFDVLRASDPAPFLRESIQWLRSVVDR